MRLSVPWSEDATGVALDTLLAMEIPAAQFVQGEDRETIVVKMPVDPAELEAEHDADAYAKYLGKFVYDAAMERLENANVKRTARLDASSPEPPGAGSRLGGDSQRGRRARSVSGSADDRQRLDGNLGDASALEGDHQASSAALPG